ncbi:FecR family protein [Olleya sp. HaHaR_3_96]|uniref:FecR family protein n=1 Tax=Olleya sp. HaHaR_3_96 TaxID=2745560 RepID=UPI001C4F3616|nr:FecR family protein [Olleya sp. HaHaR_3_96]QXP60040.1 FecR family protein [Olleya sp. HaHaR_3_96]
MKEENNILKWFNNDLSKQELDDLKQSEDFKTLEKIKHYSAQMQAPKVDAQHALEAFNNRKLTKTEPKVIPLHFKTFFKVAAMVIVLLGVSYFAFFNNTTNFTTQIAETETLQLPDQSEVILNAKSSLSYNKKTWDDHRDLTLDGEAFFKVSKGQKFTVTTDAGIVQVLGTQFNVKERDHYFEVICYEGLVSVTHNNKTVKLSKGKGFKVVNGVIQLIDNDTTTMPSWLQAESSFNKIALQEVIAELERQYDVTIKAPAIDIKQLFTGTFTHNNLNTALQSITIPLKISFKIEGKTVTFYKYEG